jgi:hypothetical protein
MATAIAEKNIDPKTNEKSAKVRKPLTWEAFKNRYLTREDGYTYEWVNGEVEKTKRTMDYTQLSIIDNIFEYFDWYKSEYKINGRLTNTTFESN